MAATEPIDTVELGVGDAQAGLLLSTETGWNQNEADWRFFLSQGVVFGMRDGARLVATAALLPHSAGNAWISMVLVTADFRRRGIATKLVDACLNVAARRGLTTWLDATPAGATVYGPLGFTPTLQLRRLRLTKPQGTGASRPLSAGNLDALAARDGSAMGFDRSTSSHRAGTSSGHFNACASVPQPSPLRNRRSLSPARNLDRKCHHAP